MTWLPPHRASATEHVAPVAGIASIGEVPTRFRDRVPVAQQLEVAGKTGQLEVARVGCKSDGKVAGPGRRLDLGKAFLAEQLVGRTNKRASQDRMVGGCSDWIVVDVEDAVVRRQIGSPDLVRWHHPASQDIVAQRLHLEPAISEDVSPV